MTNNYKKALEVIDQAVDELLPPEDPQNDGDRKLINELIACTFNGYVLVQWPESQDFMEEDWFEEEAILALGSEDLTGSSAYFVPIKRIL